MVIDVLEYQTLSIIRDRLNYLRHAHVLKSALFKTQQTRYIFELIADYHNRHDGNLTIRALRIMLTSKLKSEELPKFRGIIRRIKKNTVNNSNLADDIIKRFIQRQLMRQVVLEAIDNLEKGEETDLERVREKIDQAISINTTNIDEAYNFFKDPLIRIQEEASEYRIPTGICEELDQVMGGGLAAGEIGLIIAPTGVGKTLTLVNIGYGALTAGKKVVHATLEISPRKVARRYDTRISGRSFTELRDDPSPLNKRLKLLRTKGADLRIKDYTSTLCSVSDLRVFLERMRGKGFKTDLLIVDYADLMYTQRQYKEKRHELSSIVAGLRRLGNEFRIPVWTASQANREAGRKGTTSLWDIAEDIGKANWADFALTISQGENDKDEGILTLKVAKTRLDKGNPKIKIFVDYDTMKMRGAKKEISEVRRKLRG